MKKCSDCEYFHKRDVDTGVCRRKPPVNGSNVYAMAAYPRIDKNFLACGEFQPKTNAKTNRRTTK